MKLHLFNVNRITLVGRLVWRWLLVIPLSLWAMTVLSSPAAAQQKYVVKPLAQIKIKHLPPGPLYWRVENFPSVAQAKAAAG